MEPFWNYPPCFGPVALPPQAPLVLRILMLCFVPVLTSDLLPIPFKQFLLQRTLCFLASNSTQSPRNVALILLVSLKSSISLKPGPLNNIVLNANYSPLLAILTLFTLCGAPGKRPYAACWMYSAELTIRPITLDWIKSSTGTSWGGEFSSHPGMVVASSILFYFYLPHNNYKKI